MSVYTIDTTLRSEGIEHSCDYFPDGLGWTYDGYVTSYSQYVNELRSQLTSSKVKLYTISSSGSSSLIDDDQDLRNAVDNLPDGGELAVTAIKDESSDNGGGLNENVAEIMQHFGVPSSCYYECGDTASRKRYFWVGNNDYCICESCYYELSEWERDNWKAGNDAGLPWEGLAPHATLCQEDGLPVREEVCHLQYILTRMGFMSLDHTSSVVGSYYQHTAMGVQLFRESRHIYGGDMGVYNSRTADELQVVVHSWRNRGAVFI